MAKTIKRNILLLFMTLTLAGIFLYSCSPSNRIVLDSLSIDIPYEIKDKTDKGNQIVISTENPDIVINIEENKNQKLANATVQTIEEYSTLIDTSKTEFPKIDNVELVTKWPIELESGFKGYQVLFEYNNNSYIITSFAEEGALSDLNIILDSIRVV